MRKMTRFSAVLAAVAVAGPVFGQSINVQPNGPGVKVNPGMWGIFYEEINHAGDGGLYAEMVQNGGLEESALPPDIALVNAAEGNGTVRTRNGWERKLTRSPLEGWSAVSEGSGAAKITLATETPLHARNPHSLRVDVTSVSGGRAGVANSGYWGMNVVTGQEYALSFAARSEGKIPITATLETPDGKTAVATAKVGEVSGGWQKYSVALKADGSATNARLVLSAGATGTVWLDAVSLMPGKTFKDRPNGMRLDIATAIADMKPGFMRFPGGCVVEGCSLSNRIEWKNTIGPREQRPGRWDIWGYHTPEGLGFHEYLQFCEDLGAAPMYVVNVGMSCQYRKAEMVTDDATLQPYIQDTLDALEYAMGPADSKWGAERVKNGHAEPFQIKYVEIGNENWGATYHHNYKLFYDAIKARYPRVITIADEPIPGAPVETVDEHYYVGPNFFFGAAHKYDAYDRKGPKIYVGEYAVNQNVGAGNLMGALAEAAFMTGMERNADVVTMASYAPLLENVRDREWPTNLIRFDSSRVIHRSSYLVQKLFGQNTVSRTIPVNVDDASKLDPQQVTGQVGVGTWNTQAQFKDFKVTAGDKVLVDGIPADRKPLGEGGKWSIDEDGNLAQDGDGRGCRTLFGDEGWSKYSFSVKARKTGGNEGFLILVHSHGADNRTWWNVGGWNNTAHALEQARDGANREVTPRVHGRIEAGRWYDVRVDVDGPEIACYLDGKLVQKGTIAPEPRLFASAGVDDATGETVVKIVNRTAETISPKLNLGGTVKTWTLAGTAPTDENNFENPDKLKVIEGQAELRGGTIALPPYSLTVVRK